MGAFTAATDLAPFCANDNETISAFLMDIRGQAAALAGVSSSANPYLAGSFDAACWSAGWNAAAREIAAPCPSARAPTVRFRAVVMEPCAI